MADRWDEIAVELEEAEPSSKAPSAVILPFTRALQEK
jgi:hypothetical protein